MQDGELSDNSILDVDRVVPPHRYPGRAMSGNPENDALLHHQKCALNPMYS